MNNDDLAHDLQMQDDYETRNYPPEGDTTSEGGSGAANVNAFSKSPPTQRRADKEVQAQQTKPTPSNPNPGPGPSLIDQSPDGGPLASELQDAQQGSDPRAREAFAHAARRDFDRVGSPYGRRPNPNPNPERDSAGEERGASASAYADARGRQFESGLGGGAGEDVGAF
ncbi:hypothetical protein V8D89_001813 [Ganoderma adspersum]